MNAPLHGSSDLLTTARPKHPYPGLRAFEAEEWSTFFGRERMVDEVIELLASHHLVLIHGSSGSGKSSLVRAGVLPKLARQHLRAGAPWRTCSVRPSGGPLWNLAREFARLEGDAEDVDRIGQIVGQFNRRGATLSAVAGSLKVVGAQRFCVLIDQFEELFRFEKETSREEAELFIDLLIRSDVEISDGEMINQNEQMTAVHVVVTMRSEFLGECARFNGLAEAINRSQYLVPRMDREGLLRAIRRPAQLYGGEVSLDLAERLIAGTAGRDDELPLIQHGLMLMWHQAVAAAVPDGRIVLDAAPLEAAGGLAHLLSAHADDVVDAAVPELEWRYAVERLFRELTDVNVEGKAIRRPQAFRDLVAAIGIDANVLLSIVDALRCDGVSFLTPYSPQPIVDTTTIDISHECLIRCWDRIANPQGWLKREFDDGLVWRSLLLEARSFERDSRRVLAPAAAEERSDWWRDRKLNAAWAERYGGNFGLVHKFLATSQKAAASAQRRTKLGQFLAAALLIVVLAAPVWNYRAFLSDQWRWYTVTRPYSISQVRPYVLSGSRAQALKPGEAFKECAQYCPEMIVVPAGSFMMGSPRAESGRSANEDPPHSVTFQKPFAVSRYEVTFADWDACLTGGGCNGYKPDDRPWGRDQQPVINVSWNDAKQYVKWLSQVTGRDYRLLYEAEYEYAARAGTETVYPWGDGIKSDGKAMANCDGCGDQLRRPVPVGSFPANQFGLYDVVGNVSEWVEDCYHPDFQNAPSKGSVWAGGDCSLHMNRGGSWYKSPTSLRCATRYGSSVDTRSNSLGFRVARTLS